MKKLIITALIALAGVPAVAGTSSAGTVNTINPTQSILFFQQTGVRSNRPACSTLDRWAIDTSTSGGQAMVAALLTSYSLGRQIVITGTGTCSLWADTESVSYFAIVG